MGRKRAGGKRTGATKWKLRHTHTHTHTRWGMLKNSTACGCQQDNFCFSPTYSRFLFSPISLCFREGERKTICVCIANILISVSKNKQAVKTKTQKVGQAQAQAKKIVGDGGRCMYMNVYVIWMKLQLPWACSPFARDTVQGWKHRQEKKTFTLCLLLFFFVLPEESGKQGFCFSPLRCMGFWLGYFGFYSTFA